jgi:nucleotide-binding universal stress UspA family protein
MPVAEPATMTKILVGVDLSPCSELAVATAVDRARHDDAEVVLALVEPPPDDVSAGVSPNATVAIDAYLAAARRQLAADRAQLAALRERWAGAGARISQLVLDGRPDERLPEVAAEIGASLIVVGSHGRTGIKRVLLGSVAERVLRLAGVSVLVARGDAPSGGYRRVVIGTDFSELAVKAGRQALGYLAADARVELVHCWQTPVIGASMDVPVMMPWHDLTEDLERDGTAQAAALATHLGVPVAFRLVAQAPGWGLVETAERRGADLIVVGSHGRRGLRRFLLGSVAERTARHAPCATLVAR